MRAELLLGAAAITCLLGCRASTPAVARLASEPERELRDVIARGEIVGSWARNDPAWTLQNLEPTRRGNIESSTGPERRLPWRATSDDPQLRLEVDLEASKVTAVLATLLSSQAGEAKLFWAGEGEDYDESRQVTMIQGSRRETLRFDVASHPRWTGSIRSLRLDPPGGAGSRVGLDRLEVVRAQLLEEVLATLGPDPSWIELELDRRPGWPVGAAGRVWKVSVPRGPGARLSFSFGNLGSQGLPDEQVELELELRDEVGRWLAGWTGVARAVQGWIPVELPLDHLAGRRIEIRVSGRSSRPSDSVAAIASLELYSTSAHAARSTSQRGSSTR